jgi:hypothetical protein
MNRDDVEPVIGGEPADRGDVLGPGAEASGELRAIEVLTGLQRLLGQAGDVSRERSPWTKVNCYVDNLRGSRYPYTWCSRRTPITAPDHNATSSAPHNTSPY